MVDAELLTLLACPRCKGPLTTGTDDRALVCPACGLAYRADDGVPILLLEEARPASEHLEVLTVKVLRPPKRR